MVNYVIAVPNSEGQSYLRTLAGAYYAWIGKRQHAQRFAGRDSACAALLALHANILRNCGADYTAHLGLRAMPCAGGMAQPIKLRDLLTTVKPLAR